VVVELVIFMSSRSMMCETVEVVDLFFLTDLTIELVNYHPILTSTSKSIELFYFEWAWLEDEETFLYLLIIWRWLHVHVTLMPLWPRWRCPGPRQLRHPKVEFLSLVVLGYTAAMLCSTVLRFVFWVIALVPWACPRLVQPCTIVPFICGS
jgi:hypothetical protein